MPLPAEDADDNAVTIQFLPALWRQRRRLAHLIVRGTGSSSVIDLGCGEGRFLEAVVQDDRIKELSCVDIDAGVLLTARKRVAGPALSIPSERRRTPLTVRLYRGSVLDAPSQGMFEAGLGGCAVALEVVEHLYPDQTAALGDAIFGRLCPNVAIVSTPNVTFNALFGNKENSWGTKFRDPDHKFEWTRRQFREWVQIICAGYNYAALIVGLGEAPVTTTQASSMTRDPMLTLRWLDEQDCNPKLTLIFPPKDKNLRVHTDDAHQNGISESREQSGTPLDIKPIEVFGIPVIASHCRSVSSISVCSLQAVDGGVCSICDIWLLHTSSHLLQSTCVS